MKHMFLFIEGKVLIVKIVFFIENIILKIEFHSWNRVYLKFKLFNLGKRKGNIYTKFIFPITI